MKTSKIPAAGSAVDRPSDLAGAPHRSTLDWAREAGEAERVVRDLDALLRRRRSKRIRLAVTGVVLLMAGLGSVPWWRSSALLTPNPSAQVANAILHRPATRTLPDGSVIELNAGAEIDVDFAGAWRRVALRKGEAHFQIAKDPSRTFVVTAEGVEVRAVGTAFSVGVGAQRIEVLVTEGRVAVAAPPERAATLPDASAPPALAPIFGAGQRIQVELNSPGLAEAEPRATPVSDEEMEQRLSWRVPRLELSATPLAQVLPMFSQYGRVRLTLADPELDRLLLSGVLRADDTESLLRLLEGDFKLKAERRDREIVLRRR